MSQKYHLKHKCHLETALEHTGKENSNKLPRPNNICLKVPMTSNPKLPSYDVCYETSLLAMYVYIIMWVIEVRKCNVIFYIGLHKKLHLSKFDLQTTQTSLHDGKEDN